MSETDREPYVGRDDCERCLQRLDLREAACLLMNPR